MQPTVLVVSGKLDMLAALIAGPLANAEVFPFVNEVDPGPNAVIGDFTPGSFTGSVAQVITPWGAPFINGNDAGAIGPALTFAWTAGVTDETVYGFVLTDTGGDLLGYFLLDVPKPMGEVGDAIPLVPKYVFSGGGAGSFIDAGA